MFLAARGYVDLTYCAAIVWAAALRDRAARGAARACSCCCSAAELIRPDAWLLAGLYWLWCVPQGELAAAHPLGGDRRRRGRCSGSGSTGSSPASRCIRCTSTQNTAVALGRTVPLAQLPGDARALPDRADQVGRRRGRDRRRRARRLARAAADGRARSSCCSAGSARSSCSPAPGLSVIDRYLLMPAVMILVFCAFALSGWTMLERGLLRRLWALGARRCSPAIGIYLAASTLSLNKIETELGFRDSGHTSLVAILDNPTVKRDARLRAGLGARPQARPRRAPDPQPRPQRRDRPRRRALPERRPAPAGALRAPSSTASRSTRSALAVVPLRARQPQRQPARPGPAAGLRRSSRTRSTTPPTRRCTPPGRCGAAASPTAPRPPLRRRRRRRARASRSACGCGAIGSGLPWVYNVDEAQHFVPLRGRRCSAATSTRGYFANPPAFTYLLAGLLEARGSAARAATIYHSADSTQVWVLARRHLGGARHARGLAALPRRRAPVRPPRRPARRGGDGRRLPAGLLRQARAQRRPDARAGLPVAVGQRRRSLR